MLYAFSLTLAVATASVTTLPPPVFTSSVKDGRWKLKYFLHDPASMSISVNQTGVINFLQPIDMTPNGEDVHVAK